MPTMIHVSGRTHRGGRARLLSTAAITLLFLGGCGAPAVDVPTDAPLQRADCGWSESTELAFAGWSTPAKLKLEGLGDPPGTPPQIYALVTLDVLPSPGEAAQPVRRFCARSIDGEIQKGSVAETWRPPADPAP